MKILITGVKGFMGTNFAEYYLRNTKHAIVGVATGPNNPVEKQIVARLKDENKDRFDFYPCDITNSSRLKLILDNERPDAILNFASQSNVVKSFEQPYDFFKANLEGVVHLLEWLRHSGQGTRMLHFSTEEVFGADDHKRKEDEALFPKNPYSASKAAAEQYIYAYNACFNTGVQIARPVNNYGPYQNPNKILSRTIIRCMKGEPFKMYAEQHPHKRFWLYVEDTFRAADLILKRGEKDGVYNITPQEGLTTEEAVLRILTELDQKRLFQGHFASSRTMDAEHYKLDGSKLRALGWKPKYTFAKGIKRTIKWFRENPTWYSPENIMFR